MASDHLLSMTSQWATSKKAHSISEAPSELVQKSGKWTIKLVSGQVITIPNGTILASLAGKLTLTEVAKLECQLKVNKPADGSAPYTIKDETTTTGS